MWEDGHSPMLKIGYPRHVLVRRTPDVSIGGLIMMGGGHKTCKMRDVRMLDAHSDATEWMDTGYLFEEVLQSGKHITERSILKVL